VGPSIRPLFLETLAAVRPVLVSPAVAACWDEPSALSAFSVRGLAGHLVRAALVVDQYLDRPDPSAVQPISPAAYFAHLDSDISSALNVGVRQRGEELVAELDRLIMRLSDRLTREPEDRLIKVAGDAVMRLDDYLGTRLVEMTAHADDLAVSVGLDDPALPPEDADVALGVLLNVARHRHGDIAILRALPRRERASGDVLPVFWW
jgi:uncharacterized protein (TIGR03083 family)